MIYHYTSVDTLIKILEHRALWASDLSKMNDPKEYIAGLEILREQFSKTFPGAIAWFDNNEFVGSHSQQLILGSSFSYASDDLNQWRAYGDDGCGVAIGIDRELLCMNNITSVSALTSKASRESSYVHFEKVLYSKDDFIAHAKALFASAGQFTENLVDSYTLSLRISRLACCYKSDFYRYEKEVRAIIEHSKRPELYKDEELKELNHIKLNFRNSKYGLAAYCKLYLGNNGDSSVKAITLGPKCNVSEEDLRFMLLARGYGDVSIQVSKGHYR